MARRSWTVKPRGERQEIVTKWFALKKAGDPITQRDYAKQAGITAKTLGEWLKDPRLFADHRGGILPEPIQRVEDLPYAARDRAENTPEGFRRFFDHYSEYTMQPHSFAFVRAAYQYAGPCSRGGCPEPAPWKAKGELFCDGHAHRVGYRDRVILLEGAELVGHWKASTLITVPPNHAKSRIFSIWLGVFFLALDRNLQIIVLSQTDVLAKNFATSIIRIFEDNMALNHDFGRFRPLHPRAGEWSPGEGQIVVAGSNITTGYSLLSRGNGQQIQGMRVDVLITDDLCDPLKNISSLKVRDALADWYRGLCDDRLNPGAIEFVIGTRWHPDDLYGRLGDLLDEDGIEVYEHVNFPALRDPDTGLPTLDWDKGLPLWPHPKDGTQCRGAKCTACRSVAFLKQRYRKKGRFAFMQEYQQIPIPPGSTKVLEDWYNGCLDNDRRFGTPEASEPDFVRVLSIDPTAGGPGYAAWMLMDLPLGGGEEFGGRLIYWGHDRYWGETKMLRELEYVFTRFRQVNHLIIEYNTPSYALRQNAELQAICARFDVMLHGHTTQANKRSAEIGVDTLAVDFEAGRIRIPNHGDPDTQQALHPLRHEILTFPVGETDDFFMALWFIKAQRRRLRGTMSFAQQDRGGWDTPVATDFGRGAAW